MADFFEIDFLDVEAKKSGDAIPLRYEINGQTRIHVTDGGYQATGDALVAHINKFYGNPKRIDSVIVSHPDGDHAGGLRKLFEVYDIGELWMLRPWLYAGELITRFARYTSVENLAKHLKELYANLAELEQLAEDRKVPIREPFQGVLIGSFRVMAPSKSRYLDLIVESDKTPQPAKEASLSLAEAARFIMDGIVNLARAAWGKESFPSDDTSAENNMSVIQYASLCGKKILLTADAGRSALKEAADYAPYVGLTLPGIDRIQVPHHGSRHNVSTEILDRWLGIPLENQLPTGTGKFTAIVSAAKEDDHHPRKAVVRAFIHRGARVSSTENGTKCMGHNAPPREGWSTAEAIPYPEEQEE